MRKRSPQPATKALDSFATAPLTTTTSLNSRHSSISVTETMAVRPVLTLLMTTALPT
ncbi:hypothetical protein D3C85_530760 [compost metagenome]